VENGTFVYRKKEIQFTPGEVLADLEGFAEEALRRLYHD